ncbi:hypothetical protein FQN57_001734 [Myotisia sp. PD_48]|nr:hypothetical protein FQN57_001734 [Myotisia sp. PD_48]
MAELRVTRLKGLVQSNPVPNTIISGSARAIWQTWEALYGKAYWERAKKLQQAIASAMELQFWCNDHHLKSDDGPKNMPPPLGDHWWDSRPISQSGQRYVQLACAQRDSNGDATVQAWLDGEENEVPQMTICELTWHLWDPSMCPQRYETLRKLTPDVMRAEIMYLDTVLNHFPPTLLIHELSHSRGIFGDQGTDDTGGYEWGECTATAMNRHPDVSLNNADSFALLVTALSLQQCNWHLGVCDDEPPTEAGIPFRAVPP